jgi:Acetyltransferase (GNAT) domain
VIEIETRTGPLDEQGLAAVGELYGRVDAKYRRPTYLRHLFVENPYGWAIHAFARDGDEVVGHCAVVPVRARVAGRPTDSGKVEAYVVDERYRRDGERGRGHNVALDVLTAVTEAAAGRGVDPLHAFLTPRIGAIFERAGYRAAATGTRPFVLATSGSLATAQGVPASIAGAVLRVGPVRADAPTAGDAELVDPARDDGSWTIAGSDSWQWFAGSGFLHALDVGGRALVSIGAEGEPVHLLGWRPKRADLPSAVALLMTLARFARQRSAPTLRIQPWHGDERDRVLVRACRLLAFAPRAPFTIYVRSARADLEPVSPSPFFYATF